MRRGGRSSSATSPSTCRALPYIGKPVQLLVQGLAQRIERSLAGRHLSRREARIALEHVGQDLERLAYRLDRGRERLAHVVDRHELAALSRDPRLELLRLQRRLAPERIEPLGIVVDE